MLERLRTARVVRTRSAAHAETTVGSVMHAATQSVTYALPGFDDVGS